ncbi:WD repeat-containing protein 91 isoform X2 [Gopherus flavomarginatus]|uniref:WD repeat-containing protein 91 isoform X2 n=1 Tax=Gopherus flavomarginatus TaxID=286002 RepID=UPI0021CBDFA5|nr:WD repeat-containing protein 91 isoform X2 [Gopherus flavomarginatus]
MAAAAERMDELVREYLLFRGFTGTLKQLDAEIKADREKGFRVDKIVEQLQQFIQSYDLSALRDYWNYLDRRLFSRLEDVYRPTVNKLKTSLFRYYLVYTVQTNRNDKAQEFFLKQASELQNQVEWKDWFVLPFLPTPDSNPAFATYFSRQWADTFIVSLHNFLSVLFQCMPVPVIFNFDAECQRSTLVQEENDILRQKLFALQAETYRMKKEELQQQQEEESVVHHRLPAYVSNMDRLGDSELDMTHSQRSTAHSLQSRGGFLSSLLSQSKKGPSRSALTTGISPTQAGGILLGKKEPSNHQSTKGKEVATGCKDVKSHFPGLTASEPSSVPQRQRRLQDHGKERKELLSKVTSQGQSVEKKTETGAAEAETSPELHTEQSETFTKASAFSTEAGGVRQEQPFIVLSQEEYGEHHSSIMHCSCCWAVGLGPFVSMTPKQRRISVKLTSMKTCPAPSLITQLDLAAADTGGRGMNQVPGKLLLWDTKTMKQQLQFSLEPEPIATNCTAFNHNGNLLVTGAADGIIRLFDMQQHECALSWTAHDGEVYSVEFSYDENTVYSIGEDGKFIQWNIHKSGSKVSEYVLPMDATGPFVLSGYSGYKQVQVPRGRLFAFDSEGNYMLTCSSTGGIIYKLNSDEKILESCLSLGGHRAPVVTVDWCTAMDCGTCLTASMDGKIKLTTLLAQKP